MGFLDKVFSSKNEDSDIEEFLNNLDVKEEDMYENADAYVKPLLLTQEKDAQLAVEEMKKGNIVLLNIGDLAKRNAIKLRELISTIKDAAQQVDGDIARISVDRVIIPPARVKIIKRSRAE